MGNGLVNFGGDDSADIAGELPRGGGSLAGKIP